MLVVRPQLLNYKKNGDPFMNYLVRVLHVTYLLHPWQDVIGGMQVHPAFCRAVALLCAPCHSYTVKELLQAASLLRTPSAWPLASHLPPRTGGRPAVCDPHL